MVHFKQHFLCRYYFLCMGNNDSWRCGEFGSCICLCYFFNNSETDRLAALIFENANGQQLAGVRFVLVGLLIMILMIFRPSGLLGKKEELLLNVK